MRFSGCEWLRMVGNILQFCLTTRVDKKKHTEFKNCYHAVNQCMFPGAAHHCDIEILGKALSQKPFLLKQSMQCVRHSFWLWKVCVLIWFMCILCTLVTFDGCITKILSIFCPIQNELTFEIYVENARFSTTFDLNHIQHTQHHSGW